MEKLYPNDLLKIFALVPCVIGCFLPTLSTDIFFQLPSERVLFKTIGSIFFIAGLTSLLFIKGLNLKSLLTSFFLTTFFYIFSISSFIYDSSGSLNHLLRAFMATMICYFFLELNKRELGFVVSLITIILSLIAIIGVSSIFFGFSNGEKFPIINIYSTKSIIFEQNVYGIAMLFLIFIASRYKKFSTHNLFTYIIIPVAVVALLFSFYRTVYVCLAVLLLANSKKKISWLVGLTVMFYGLIYAFNLSDQLFEIFKLDQLSNLTGRTEMYSVGWNLFIQFPLIGSSELSVPNHIQFTTFHNLFIDTLVFGGIVGFISLIMSYLTLLRGLQLERSLGLFILLLPSLANTFYFFAPNILGFTITAVLFSYQLNSDDWK